MGLLAISIVISAMIWLSVEKEDVPTGPSRSMNTAGGVVGAAPAGEHSMAPEGQESAPSGPIVVLPERFDLSPRLRDIPPVVSDNEGLLPEIDLPLPGREDVAGGGPTPNLQDWHGSINMPAPTQNFEGIHNINSVLPPDTQGDVGPNHYVQWVNVSYAVYDKTGSLLLGPTDGNTIWSGFGGVCETTNMGDPITIYDHDADRWMMSQFAFTTNFFGNPQCPCYQCVAVSQTPDPTEAWYRYAYSWPGNKFNDYPHFGLWPDGYYATVNQFSCSLFGCSWGGAGVAAFERTEMLVGNPSAQMIYFDLYGVDVNYGGQLPADWEGSTPPTAGVPNYILEWDEAGVFGGSDAVGIWEFSVDWDTPANSTLGTGAPGGPNYVINTDDVDTDLCGNTREQCIDQPGTPVQLEAISDRLMYRVQYRNLGTHESMVANHTVDANGSGRAGIHWFELRDSGGGWSMYQQSTYSPDDLHRWMGSIAMDQNGNIAMGYSVSSSSVYPSIRYVGRLATDPLDSMPQGETTLVAGGGSQTHEAARWGDYSSLTLDASDSCTFWYTQEYIQSTGSAPWRTRIGAFLFDGCGPTAVKLASFEARPDAVDILISWETESEIDNLGFNLYRSTVSEALGERLNEGLIPSKVPGGSYGASYAFLDETAWSGATYYYTLEDVDGDGRRTQHGPVVLAIWRVYLPVIAR
jgi:hypothetical protein